MKRLTACLLCFLLITVTFPRFAHAGLEEAKTAYHNGDYLTAYSMWKPFVQEGNAEAQYWLGQIYWTGHGVEEDLNKAVKLFRLSSNQEFAEAQYSLAVMYMNGIGVIQDYKMAHMYFNVSSANGHRDARYNREILAKKMTNLQIAEAQDMAREWISKH